MPVRRFQSGIFSANGLLSTYMTTMALTVLAFPIISLILEFVLGRVKLSSLGIYELASFALMVLGYMVFISKPMTQ